MTLLIGSNIRVVNPSDELIKWCEDNLIIANPEYAKKARMGFWLGNTPKTLRLYAIDGNDYILPFGVYNHLPLEALLSDTEYLFGDDFQFSYDALPMNLYDYQLVAVDKMYELGNGILQAPAGSGKTQMGIALAIKWGYRCLWICHTKDLVQQSKTRAEQFINPRLLGTITEGKVDIGLAMTFATVQTLSRLDLSQYRHIWDVIIVDECHRVAGTPSSVTMYQKVLNSLAARHKYGLSATVHRADGLIKATYCLLGDIAYEVPEEAVKDRIMQVTINPVETDTNISRQCLNTDGTLNFAQMITYLTQNEDRNACITQELCNCYLEGHSCLVLSHRVNHLKALRNSLQGTHIYNMSVLIDGKMTSKKAKAEREQALDDMRSGKKRILFATYNLCKEGLDIPRLDRLFLTTPVTDYAVVAQSVGRIDRKCEGKQDAICYDFVDNFAYAYKAYKKRQRHYRKVGCRL